jgi:hypothetical protein
MPVTKVSPFARAAVTQGTASSIDIVHPAHECIDDASIQQQET